MKFYTVKKCPLCAGNPEIVRYCSDFNSKCVYRIECVLCGLRPVMCKTIKLAVEKWNTRPVDSNTHIIIKF